MGGQAQGALGVVLALVTHSVWETENRRAYESSLQHHDCEGPVETNEKAAVYSNDLDISISVRLVEDFQLHCIWDHCAKQNGHLLLLKDRRAIACDQQQMSFGKPRSRRRFDQATRKPLGMFTQEGNSLPDGSQAITEGPSE